MYNIMRRSPPTRRAPSNKRRTKKPSSRTKERQTPTRYK